MKSLRLLIQLSRPMNILSAILVYLLGSGITHYLNGHVSWTLLFLGLAWIVIVLLGGQYLNEFFDPIILVDDPAPKHTPFSGGSGAIGKGKLPQQAALWAGLTCFAVAASLFVIIFQNQGINPAGGLIFGLIVIIELLYALPPFRMVSSGYGEIIQSVIIGGLIPALAFVLQGHDFHRILVMVAFSLSIMHLGMLIALELPDYASDLKQAKRPLLIRVGWQRGMVIHNILVLGSFVILGMAFAFGLPLRVCWPVFFVLPVALYQIWMMYRIADGAKPNWSLLTLVAFSTFELTAYIITFAFWTH